MNLFGIVGLVGIIDNDQHSTDYVIPTCEWCKHTKDEHDDDGCSHLDGFWWPTNCLCEKTKAELTDMVSSNCLKK